MKYRDENNEWQEMYLEPSGDTLPIGTITQYGGENAPINWLICDGSAISRTDYANLFNVIGTTYGEGDGESTFNLPDLRGKVGVGLSSDEEFNELGKIDGEKTHTLTINEMPSHRHQTRYGDTAGGDGSGYAYSNTVGINTQIVQATGEDQPHNNLQPYLVINYIIKYDNAVGLVGTVSENINSTDNNTVPTCETVKNYVDNYQEYSTEETICGTYKNKPLYRKIFNFGTLPNASTKTVNHNIQVDVAKSISIIIYRESDNEVFTPTTNEHFWFNRSSVVIACTSDRTNCTAEAILEYTKN